MRVPFRLPSARVVAPRGLAKKAHAQHLRHAYRRFTTRQRARARHRRAYEPSAVLEVLSVFQLMWPVLLFAVVMLWVAGFSGSP